MFDKIIAYFEDHMGIFLLLMFVVLGVLSGLTGEMHHI